MGSLCCKPQDSIETGYKKIPDINKTEILENRIGTLNNSIEGLNKDIVKIQSNNITLEHENSILKNRLSQIYNNSLKPPLYPVKSKKKKFHEKVQ